jgi:hypothetical protein
LALSGRADLPVDVRSAALEVVRSLFIPDGFTLVVPSDQFKRPCHIVWRKEKRIGVAFGKRALKPSSATGDGNSQQERD